MEKLNGNQVDWEIPISKAKSNARITPESFGKAFALMILCTVFVELFRIEKDLKLPELMPWILLGFVVHSITPYRWKLPSLAMVTFLAMWQILGLHDLAVIMGGGVALLGILHLPIAKTARALLFASLVILLVSWRAGLIPYLGESKGLMVLGVLFMFRLILYIHELPLMPSGVSFWKRMIYFFLLPNATIPIFPVIDLKKFVSGSVVSG